MSIRKLLVKLNNKLESSRQPVDFEASPVKLLAGWYITEFSVSGVLTAVPRVSVENSQGGERIRELIGAHSGRNRVLVYFPEGKLKAHSDSIRFERLSKVSFWESRFRILLICARYLRDFFGISALLKTITLNFQQPFERSSTLLGFYAQGLKGGKAYLENVDAWKKYDGYHPRWFRLISGNSKVAVVIECESQRLNLESMLLPPDEIILASSDNNSFERFDYVIPLKKSEVLRSPSILMIKRAIKKANQKVNFIYTDHDYRWPEGHPKQASVPRAPAFKPNPSRCYLACYNYIGNAVVLASPLLESISSKELLEQRVLYSIAIEAFADPDRVLHIPETLFTSVQDEECVTPKPFANKSPWSNIDWIRSNDFNRLVAKPSVNSGPTVDLIIPTRDGLHVLKPCIDSILEKTDYQNYNIFVVDNGSELEETLAYFKEIEQRSNVTILNYPGEFNYSAINNFAAQHSSAPYLALINNDIEVIKGDWLTQMMAWAMQPDVGVVGAKLLFGDGRVQHAGVTIGMGNAAGHIHRLEAGDSRGYQLRCLATQNMMAVTAACLVTSRDLYEQLGGLNETDFKVAYNDIDYCLRVESLGQQIIWTPEAVLYHHESVSRGDDLSDVHIERYFKELESLQRRWNTKGFVDKYYSPHLRISDEGVYPASQAEQTDTMIYL
ncbi:MAG: glycosyltransferase family 2 protein [Gammaproteobacteria bacterium]|nr:glycosyltransferase family 2 protein [Gammaproteobacteria bacterium]